MNDNCLDVKKNYRKEKIKLILYQLSVLIIFLTLLQIIKNAIELLDTDAILLVAVYPGHEEGRLEGEMLYEMLTQYDRRKICVSQLRIVNSPTSPFFFLVEKR